MRNFLLGLICGLIVAGSFAQAGNPCRSVVSQLKAQAQVETLRFKQRLFINRFERGEH